MQEPGGSPWPWRQQSAHGETSEGHEEQEPPSMALLNGSGGRIRTYDLRVMSPKTGEAANPDMAGHERTTTERPSSSDDDSTENWLW